MTHDGNSTASPPYVRRRIVAGLAVILGISLVAVGVDSLLGGSGTSTKPLTRAPTDSNIRPVQLRIPAIKVAADVTDLGLNDDRTVEIPRNPDDVGWYRLGPSPGRPGSAVILGHVDSKRGPAVFYRLSQLEPGQRVAVRLADRAVAHFKVTEVVTYPIKDFPARKVYGPPAGNRPVLNLITCGGEYIKSAGGYQANVVVYTTYVGATEGRRT